MKCPSCQSEESKVADSRLRQNRRYRKRVCNQCGKRFPTTELHGNIKEDMPLLNPKVEKKNGKLEDFNRDKLLQSIFVAVRKSNRTEVPIEQIVDDIEQEVSTLSADGPVNTFSIGTQVLEALQKYDRLGYVRYLSVHQQMESADGIRTLIKELQLLLTDGSDGNDGGGGTS